jgi:regulator of sirC expression with transglutaminase-like and TPR domain
MAQPAMGSDPSAPISRCSNLTVWATHAAAQAREISAQHLVIEVLFYGTVDGLLELIAGRDADMPLDRAALELARIEFPELDAAAFVSLLDSHATELKARLGADRDGLTYVNEANRYLFEEMGFHGNTNDYYDPRNSCLNEVLTARTGIPITLSLVYLEIARRLERPVRGIGLPGHFIVRYDDGLYSAFLDPFHGGRRLEPDECIALAREASHVEIEPNPKWLAPVGKRDILIRMLRNLGAAYTSRGLTGKAIDVLSLLIRANPDSADEYRQRGILEVHAGRVIAAKQDLARYLELAPTPEERERARLDVQKIQHWLASMN